MRQPETRITTGFSPIASSAIHTLVLGTLPSRQSIAAGEYYGHPQNAFWRIMADLFGEAQDSEYALRAQRLVDAGVGIWDVLRASVRPGSLDASIDGKTARPNDFNRFFRCHPHVRRTVFNGQAAGRLFRTLVIANGPAAPDWVGRMEFVTLPSTSPAYASMRYAEKRESWSVVATRPAGLRCTSARPIRGTS